MGVYIYGHDQFQYFPFKFQILKKFKFWNWPSILLAKLKRLCYNTLKMLFHGHVLAQHAEQSKK